MKRNTLLATLFCLGATASAAAQDMQGSDTLFEFMNDSTSGLLANCPGAAGINYVGGGSSTGETALKNELANPPTGNQQVAPMSRKLKTTGACDKNSGNNAQALVVGLDGIAMVRATSTQVSCNAVGTQLDSLEVTDQNGTAGLDCPGCSGTTYQFNNWADALKVLYGGLHHDGTKACNSDVRFSLANNWSALFAGDCTGESCTQIRHAFRRADNSGTTDTFASLVGLGSLSSTTFCNGNERQDNDPIKRTCDATEQVCSLNKTLGLVMAIRVPEKMDMALAINTNACTFGKFEWFNHVPLSACPNGQPARLGKCLFPLYQPTAAAGTPGCLNSAGNWPPGTPNATRSSGTSRVYNLFVRNASNELARDASNNIFYGFHRLHSTTTLTQNATPCAHADSTQQIGCLVQASACSVGFAGREAALNVQGATAVLVNGRAPTIDNIRLLVTDPTSADKYPLARNLYINTLRGFANVTVANQQALVTCAQDKTKSDAASTAAGFVTLPDASWPTILAEAGNPNACE